MGVGALPPPPTPITGSTTGAILRSYHSSVHGLSDGNQDTQPIQGVTTVYNMIHDHSRTFSMVTDSLVIDAICILSPFLILPAAVVAMIHAPNKRVAYCTHLKHVNQLYSHVANVVHAWYKKNATPARAMYCIYFKQLKCLRKFIINSKSSV